MSRGLRSGPHKSVDRRVDTVPATPARQLQFQQNQRVGFQTGLGLLRGPACKSFLPLELVRTDEGLDSCLPAAHPDADNLPASEFKKILGIIDVRH